VLQEVVVVEECPAEQKSRIPACLSPFQKFAAEMSTDQNC
jgi:hypothetical protein